MHYYEDETGLVKPQGERVTLRVDAQVLRAFRATCKKSRLTQTELLGELMKRHTKATASAMLVERHQKLRTHQ